MSAPAGGLLVAACALACWPSWRWLILRLGDGGDEPFGLLAMAVVIGCLLRNPRQAPTGLGWPVMTLLLLIGHGLASELHLPPMIRCAVAICVVLSSCVAWLGTRIAPGTWILAGCALPVIASLQFWCGAPLRMLATWIAAHLVASLGLPCVSSGVLLTVDGVPVLVDGPCSGVRMLWVAVTVIAAVAAWGNWPWSRTLLALGCALLATILANAWRTAILALGHAHWLPAGEAVHTAAGIIALVTALALTLWIATPARDGVCDRP